MYTIHLLFNRPHAKIHLLLQTVAYKQLHEPNACGFYRKLAMNADMHHEYTELSYEYYNVSQWQHGVRDLHQALLARIGPYS